MGTWLLADSRVLHALGLAILLALWHTTLVALVIWGLSRSRLVATPLRRHWVAFAALVAGVIVSAVTWWVLSHPHPSVPVAAAPGIPDVGRAAVAGPPGGPVSPWTVRLAPMRFLGALAPHWAAWIVLFWALAVGVLLLRLAGGLLIAVWIRHYAIPVSTGPVPEAVKRLSQQVGYRHAIDIVESTQIEYPAATGWRRPGLIVPSGLEVSLSGPQLDPVVAHELEHLRGGDQRVAVVQDLVETLLFFCPGARWLARYAREAREHRCDDVAVRTCGSAPDYAAALGILASRASGTWFSAVMGAQSRSLASRIRRVLKGDAMKQLTRTQTMGLVAAVVATIVTGVAVLGASLEAVRVPPRAPGGGPTLQNPPPALGVPTGFAPSQDGSPLTLGGVVGDSEYCFSRVTLRNVSERPVTSATFLAVVEHRDPSVPAILVRAHATQLALEPGATAEVAITVLPIRDVLEWKVSRGVRAQAFLGLLEVGFADGDKWAITPPAGATTINEVFFFPGPEVSRALLWSPDQPRRPGADCRDDRGRRYSPGSLVAIRGEKGGVAKCADGVWEEQKPKRDI